MNTANEQEEQFDISRDLEALKAKLCNGCDTFQSFTFTKDTLRLVLDHVPSRIWFKDDKNGIIKLNKTAAESMGGTVNDFERKNTFDLFGPMAQKYLDDDLAIINSAVPKLGIIEEYTPHEGSRGWVSTDKIPICDSKNNKQLLVVSTDISELMRKEKELLEINKNLQQFSAMASHDLKAPLRHITISADLLRMELGENITPEIKIFVEETVRHVQKLRNIVDTFLNFPTSSSEGIQHTDFDARHILQTLIKDRGIDLQKIKGTATLTKEPLLVKADPILVARVFDNLIDNAIKYSDSERRLNLEISGVVTNGTMTQIIFEDNGVGVPPSQKDHIFDLFARAKDNKHISGSGIGLATCKRILVICQGEISYEKRKNYGSRFIVSLLSGEKE